MEAYRAPAYSRPTRSTVTQGSALTVFQPTKNDAFRRLRQLMDTGTEPGNRSAEIARTNGSAESGAPVDAPELSTNISEVARDRITDRVHERLSGHGLADLVAEIVRVDGYQWVVSPRGPDGGLDIYAGHGSLGMKVVYFTVDYFSVY